jgi:hypothetical protein
VPPGFLQLHLGLVHDPLSRAATTARVCRDCAVARRGLGSLDHPGNVPPVDIGRRELPNPAARSKRSRPRT